MFPLFFERQSNKSSFTGGRSEKGLVTPQKTTSSQWPRLYFRHKKQFCLWHRCTSLASGMIILATYICHVAVNRLILFGNGGWGLRFAVWGNGEGGLRLILFGNGGAEFEVLFLSCWVSTLTLWIFEFSSCSNSAWQNRHNHFPGHTWSCSVHCHAITWYTSNGHRCAGCGCRWWCDGADCGMYWACTAGWCSPCGGYQQVWLTLRRCCMLAYFALLYTQGVSSNSVCGWFILTLMRIHASVTICW